MATKCKTHGSHAFDVHVFNDDNFLSESLMQKMVQREMARIVRTSENLCVAAVCFEQLLINSLTQSESGNNIKHFIKSIEMLKRNVRETDLIGWIKKDITFGIVFTVNNTVNKETIENRICRILDVPDHNVNGVNIEIDVTIISADQNGAHDQNGAVVTKNYFKKKHQSMN